MYVHQPDCGDTRSDTLRDQAAAPVGSEKAQGSREKGSFGLLIHPGLGPGGNGRRGRTDEATCSFPIAD